MRDGFWTAAGRKSPSPRRISDKDRSESLLPQGTQVSGAHLFEARTALSDLVQDPSRTHPNVTRGRIVKH